MRVRFGELLVQRGVLTSDQRDRVLLEQRVRNRPFGVLAEELFEVDPRVISRVWAEQFAADCKWVDPRREPIDPDALRQLSRRQVWQFKLFPMRFESDELVMCTISSHLPRGLNFAYRKLGPACCFVLAQPEHLGEALQRHFPWAGAEVLDDEPALGRAAAHERGPPGD